MECETSLDEALRNYSRIAVEQKNNDGRDYSLFDDLGRQLMYFDSKGLVLIHEGKREQDRLYLLELEEKKKETPALFEVSVYQMHTMQVQWLKTFRFEHDNVMTARSEAAMKMISLREDDLSKYNYDPLECW
ncbi:MAG: hypothetical protein KKE20_07205 [Nanoarchaeota archaeon]|nr:hypothetical protein [Nanoarchaeota archaeon]